MLLREVPYIDFTEATMEIQQAITKEVSAAVNVYDPIELDYSSILSHDHTHNSRVAYNLPLNPDVHRSINQRFHSVMHQLSSSSPFLPDISRKTIGEIGRICASSTFGPIQREVLDPESTLDLELIYHISGFRVAGETEMRWAWKYNNLKPRVYYARGPNQYYSSRIIQSIFNILVDSLEITHRFQRFHPETIRILRQDTTFIYDYASFTSTLYEIRRFTESLANFFRGCIVSVLDTFEGVVDADLGDILSVFNLHLISTPPLTLQEYQEPPWSIISLHILVECLGFPATYLLAHCCMAFISRWSSDRYPLAR
jgi:hypothetical protein